ncbi:hypothetical protein [Gymnodinialimonas sp.]
MYSRLFRSRNAFTSPRFFAASTCFRFWFNDNRVLTRRFGATRAARIVSASRSARF